jgi:hypothetical protein
MNKSTKDEKISQLWSALSQANKLLEEVYELLEDSIYYDHPTTEEISEYLNVKGERTK